MRSPRRTLSLLLTAALGCLCVDTPTSAARTPGKGDPTVSAPSRVAAPDELVPQNHWSYDALTQLAQRGFYTGFPDNTFSGKRKLPRRDFAEAFRILVPNGYLVRQSGVPVHKLDGMALKRLLAEFAPVLAAMGADVAALQRGVADLTAAGPGAVQTGLSFPLPSGSQRSAVELAWSSQSDGFRAGAAWARAEWAQGLVLLYTLDPVPDPGDAFPHALPLVHAPPGPAAAEWVLGHNTEVWRRLREIGPPAGTSLACLNELFELKRHWSRSARHQRTAFKSDWLHNPRQEVSFHDQAVRLHVGWSCFAPPPITLSARTAVGEVILEAPPGLRWGWSSVDGPEVLWGRRGSGVVYLKGRVAGKKRIYAYDLRTGWLLNAAEG